MENIYRFILEKTSSGSIDKTSAAELIKKIKKNSQFHKDMAIIGISANLPLADSIDEYWDILSNSVNCIREFPADRKEDIDKYLHYSDIADDNIRYVQGAYLEHIDYFDYKFFKITPSEANLMAPSQRIFLQTAYSALEDAGYGGQVLRGSNTGVYVGFADTMKDSYQRMIYDTDPSLVSQSIASNLGAIIPSRMSYYLDLNGPSMVVDTACSSSLVSVHLACKAIINGECDQAIAGGIKLHTVPIDAEFARLGIESSDGLTRAFDDTSDGAGIGEGAIAILIKPLDKAVAARDHIYAVIRGSAVNQDGNSMGITAPNPASQTKVILKAWKDAAVNPEKIQYIETHGTGTPLGDPVEIEGLTKAFNQHTNRKQFCAIGSVKSNIGHLYECSGLASLIKVVLSLNNQMMLPSVYFEKPNRKIDFCNSAVFINSILRHWEAQDEKRLCGVSSFGFSGTNSHIVLEEAPVYIRKENNGTNRILTISAESKSSLYALLMKYQDFLNMDPDIHNMCYTANTGRGHYSLRVAVLFKSIDELKAKIAQILMEDMAIDDSDIFMGEHKIVSSTYVDIDHSKISEEMKIKFTETADKIIGRQSADELLGMDELKQLCSLYIKGAAVNWSGIYSYTENSRIRIPTYQFDKHRCWLSIPESQNKLNQEQESYFKLNWKSTDRNGIGDIRAEDYDLIVIIKNHSNLLAENLYEYLKTKNLNAEVIAEPNITGCADTSNRALGFFINSWHNYSNYSKVKFIYMMDSEVEKEVNYNNEYARLINFYGFLRSLKEMNAADIRIDVILRHINEVVCNDNCIPINAAIQGAFKVVGLEFPEWSCHVIDVDENINESNLYSEVFSLNNKFIIAYRDNQRYEAYLEQISIDRQIFADSFIMKDSGCYVISGGLSDITLEIMKNNASSKANFVLLCRTELPAREEWNDLCNEYSGQEEKTVNRIKNILDIESYGGNVTIIRCDITDYEEVRNTIKAVREKFHKINGVIHAAGIPGNTLFAAEKYENFTSVLNPKIYGAWYLDECTKEDDLEFFVMFSSVATLFPAPGQCSYVAANLFIDSFAATRNIKRQNTFAINWCTWKDAGMAKRSGLNMDTIFKTLTNEQGIRGFRTVIGHKISHALVGVINNDKRYVRLWDKVGFDLAENVNDVVKNYRLKSASTEKANKNLNLNLTQSLQLKGRNNNQYSETEKRVGNLLAKYLGYSELYIYDNLFDLGVDSIIMIRAAHEIHKIWGVNLELSKFIDGSSIEKIAAEIDHIFRNKKPAAVESR
ncbi:MAG: SDR family NAD(P)-dependent oxidoreductase [Anaerocolumna sp.]